MLMIKSDERRKQGMEHSLCQFILRSYIQMGILVLLLKMSSQNYTRERNDTDSEMDSTREAPQINRDPIDTNFNICNETYLKMNYGEDALLKSKDIMMKTVQDQCAKHYPQCTKRKDKDLRLYAELGIARGVLGVRIRVRGIRKECMTYLIEGSWHSNGQIKRFSTFNSSFSTKLIFPDYHTPYHFVVYELPSTDKRNFKHLTVPHKCAIKLLRYKLTVFSEFQKTYKCREFNDGPNEHNPGGPNPLYDHICIQSNYNFTEAKKKIYHILRTDYCHTRHPERLKDNQLILGTIISVAIFILVCLTIVYFVKSKRKCISCFGKRRTADDQDYDQHVAIMRSLSDSSEASSRCETPTVMILNRPGCEVLDTMLRDVAFILNSYGMQVRLSLLEQSQLDAEGGISSYLQRNIDSCDYILIMFTEVAKENPIFQHKPYEFALNVITGLMYHTNDCSRYLAIYTGTFEEAMYYMPTVFHASQDFGYSIPKDVRKLVEKLLGRKIDEGQKERELKNKMFLDRMKLSKKKLDSKKHEKCNSSKCHKGIAYPSVSNLSSIWATTVHSGRWPSFNSVENAENCREDLLPTEQYDSNELLHVDLWRDAHVINTMVTTKDVNLNNPETEDMNNVQ